MHEYKAGGWKPLKQVEKTFSFQVTLPLTVSENPAHILLTFTGNENSNGIHRNSRYKYLSLPLLLTLTKSQNVNINIYCEYPNHKHFPAISSHVLFRWNSFIERGIGDGFSFELCLVLYSATLYSWAANQMYIISSQYW